MYEMLARVADAAGDRNQGLSGDEVERLNQVIAESRP
jgi:hypothetical protein